MEWRQGVGIEKAMMHGKKIVDDRGRVFFNIMLGLACVWNKRESQA